MMTPEQHRVAVQARNDDPNIGRRKLIKICGCTGFAARQFLKNAGPRPSPCPPKTVAVAAPEKPGSAKAEPKGICLREARVSNSRPNEGLKHQIFGLRKGIGFPVEELAELWNASPDNVRRHGNRYGAVKWVEVGPGDWKQCLMHPDTAAEYGN